MALTATPVFPQTPKNGKLSVVSATSTSMTTVYTGGTNGSKVFGMIAVSSDTIAHDVQIAISRSGTNYILGTVNVPIGAGNTGTVPSVNLFNNVQLVGLPIDSDNNPFVFLLDATDLLAVSMVTQVSSGKAVSVTALATDF
jgi:hypothetical protein